MSHGQDNFDKGYYKRFFNEYNSSEFRIYERWFHGWYNFLNNYINLKDGKNKRVLEIGCSIGAFAKILKEHDFDVTATDISSYILKKAASLQQGVKFVKLDVEKDITLDGSFDYIFAFEAVEHLKDPEEAFKHVIKKLNKGGTFVFSTPFPTTRSLSDPTHINVHDSRWWNDLGKKVGFSKQKHVFVSFVPFFYRYSRLFSVGFSVKTDIPYINSTAIFFFKK